MCAISCALFTRVVRLVELNVLYYVEPKSVTGGVSNVAYHLTRALAKKVNMTYFPPFMPKKKLPSKFFKCVQEIFDEGI